VVLLCGGLLAAEPEVPPTSRIDRCVVDPLVGTSGGPFASLRVTCDDVVAFLERAKVVTEWQWRHEYSHVAFGDRTGRLTLQDGTVLRWLVRPGGLASLEWPDGRKAYLVRCCGERPPGAGRTP
jgi:hypothetical protein